MGLFDRFRARGVERREATIENPSVPVSADNFLRFFGVEGVSLDPISVDQALTVPAVFAAVNFLSRTLASIPLHAWRQTDAGPKRLGGRIDAMVSEAPNATWTSFRARQYFWQQVFTRGRGLIWIERNAARQPIALHPINVARTGVMMSGTETVYLLDGIRYSADEVIDLPFMLREDQCSVMSPIGRCGDAIGLALAMQKFGRKFFAGGGVPPLALTGPIPANKEAANRALNDVQRAIDTARESDKPIFSMPPGHELKPVGFDPEKSQMVSARQFQNEEIARAFQLPPVFLQDLSKGTFTNTEQQDLFFVKHLIGQWVCALEQEMNLKLFGPAPGRRYVDHNVDGLMRGDFKSRIEGIARAIQTAQLTPNEGRELEGRANKPNGDDLLVQGATVPLGTTPSSQPEKPNVGEDRDPNAD